MFLHTFGICRVRGTHFAACAIEYLFCLRWWFGFYTEANCCTRVCSNFRMQTIKFPECERARVRDLGQADFLRFPFLHASCYRFVCVCVLVFSREKQFSVGNRID